MIKFNLATSKWIWEKMDPETWVIDSIRLKERIPAIRWKRKQRNSQWNRWIGEGFEWMSESLLPWFNKIHIKGNEDLNNGNIWLEVKSGRMNGSHAVINESQIKDVQGKYGWDKFYYAIYFYTRDGRRILPEVLFVFPLPVIISFFNQSTIISRTLKTWRVRKFVVMRFKQALELFVDIQDNHKDIFETRIYSLDNLETDSHPLMCVVDYATKSSQHILSLDASLPPPKYSPE